MMKKIIDFLNLLTEKVGNVACWSAIFMVVIISVDVITRYLFKFTFIWITELEIYFFGILFMLGGGYTLKHEKHVRVDLFYARLSEKKKAWVNLIGGVVYLLPWTLIMVVTTSKYAYSSFLIRENSPQPGGLPAIYLLKFIVVIGFIFFLLQGVSDILNSISIILKDKK